MSTLNSKVAIVTGASKGIGAGIAKDLAAAGAAVVVNYSSSREGAEAVVEQIKGAGGRAVAVQGNVGKQADVQRIFAEAKKAFGRVDILVNNAGVFKFEPLEEFTETEFRRQYDINVLGPFLATQEALKYFGPDGGSVINIDSVVGQNPVAGGVLYSSTKGALDTLTVGLAKELAPRKIRVNAINPGFTETEGVQTTGILKTEFADKMIAETPLGRIGQPHDIGLAAVFLASDASAWITGETIRVSGGQR